MTELARLKFYATQPHSCSYLPEEQATTLFLDPSQPMDVHVYADLSEMGFRRSGDHLYRPHCQNCNACVPARIPVAQFNPNRQQKRIFKRNVDLQVRPVKPAFSEEYFDLYQRYIEQRHADGDFSTAGLGARQHEAEAGVAGHARRQRDDGERQQPAEGLGVDDGRSVGSEAVDVWKTDAGGRVEVDARRLDGDERLAEDVHPRRDAEARVRDVLPSARIIYLEPDIYDAEHTPASR